MIGAWTDTLLPVTAKTMKQRQQPPSKYAQTPHVSAGGWVDTPAATASRQTSAMAPITIEEVTEELDTDVQPPKDRKQDSQGPVSPQQTDAGSQELPQKQKLPRSALASIIEQQRQRLVSQDITSVPRTADDTLNLGDATIQSLEDFVTTLDGDDMSRLIRLGAEEEALGPLGLNLPESQVEAEAALLDRLSNKLHTLQSNIHNARKGISKLEHQVNHVPSKGERARQLLAETWQLPGAQNMYNPPPETGLIPLVYSTVTLPVPLLFHPRASSKSNPLHETSILDAFGRPTKLGYVTICIWTWYFVETVLSEMYSHPTYATRYTWPPPDRPEPRFGLCLPTMLVRCFGFNGNFDSVRGLLWTVFGPVFVMLRAMWRILGMWLGWTDGFVDDARAVAKNATKFAAGVVSSVLPEGTDWSMMNDEVL